MAWNGDSRDFEFTVEAVDKSLIERFANIIRRHFSKAIPPKRIKIEEYEALGSKFYQWEFKFGYQFSEVLEGDELQNEFEEYVALEDLYPGISVEIVMRIVRTNYNEYAGHDSQRVFYLVLPVKQKYPQGTESMEEDENEKIRDLEVVEDLPKKVDLLNDLEVVGEITPMIDLQIDELEEVLTLENAEAKTGLNLVEKSEGEATVYRKDVEVFSGSYYEAYNYILNKAQRVIKKD